jgi:hypothetical protein
MPPTLVSWMHPAWSNMMPRSHYQTRLGTCMIGDNPKGVAVAEMIASR